MLFKILGLLFLELSSSFAQDVPVTPARQEIQLSILAKKPGILITEIIDSIYVFIPNIDTEGIAISCFPQVDFKIPEYLSNCTIFPDSNRTTVLTDLYELSTNTSNTKVFNESVGINCRGVNTTGMGIVVQDGRSVVQFDYYYMADLEAVSADGVQTYRSLGQATGFTTVSFSGALPTITSAHYNSEQKFFYVADSTPEKKTRYMVDEKVALPVTRITPNTLFTTFFFHDIEVDLLIKPEIQRRICEEDENILQSVNATFGYPKHEGTLSTYSGSIYCNWNFIAFDDYYVEFTLFGSLDTSTKIEIRDEKGSGVFFSSDYSVSTDYKGSILNTTFNLPSSGTLSFASVLGMGSFSFVAAFRLFDANKPVEPRVLGGNDSSYLINMDAFQFKQFFFDTGSLSSTFQLGIFAAPSYVHRSYIQSLDNCFVQTKDVNGMVERYSLRSSFECGPLRPVKTALVGCMGNFTLEGYLLVNGYDNASMALIGEACSRMASSVKNIVIAGNNSALKLLTALMVIKDDLVDTVTLFYLKKNTTDPLEVINGAIFGEQLAAIDGNSDLPFYTQRKLVTYRLTSSAEAVLNFTVLTMNPIPQTDNSSRFNSLLICLICGWVQLFRLV